MLQNEQINIWWFQHLVDDGKINCPLESADKLINVSDRIQDTTYFAVFFILQTILVSNPAICLCYYE